MSVNVALFLCIKLDLPISVSTSMGLCLIPKSPFVVVQNWPEIWVQG